MEIHRDSINNATDNDIIDLCTVEPCGRKLRDITVDSGAGESEWDPDDLPEISLEESPGSRKGQKYLGAGQEKISNLGQKKFAIRLEAGGRRKVTFQAAKTRKPLMA
eukprot:2167086-Karenia_brevis.AAC.1